MVPPSKKGKLEAAESIEDVKAWGATIKQTIDEVDFQIADLTVVWGKLKLKGIKGSFKLQVPRCAEYVSLSVISV